MSKKKKKQNQETTIENYYDLRVDKIDELVEALKSDEPVVDAPLPTSIAECTGTNTPDTKTKNGKDKEFDPYKIDKLARVPAWLKALFIKFWFSGAICYFFMMGLGVYITSTLDMIVLVGVMLGIITDVMINPIFRMMESDEKEYNAYMMFPFPFKAFWTFFTNIIYYLGVIIVVNYVYLFIDGVCHIYIAVEPLMFGLIVLAIDMACIGIKDLIVHLVKRAKAKKLAADEIAAEQPAVETVNTAEPIEEDLPLTEDGKVDEVERLRRIAERENAEKNNNGRKKPKKK